MTAPVAVEGRLHYRIPAERGKAILDRLKAEQREFFQQVSQYLGVTVTGAARGGTRSWGIARVSGLQLAADQPIPHGWKWHSDVGFEQVIVPDKRTKAGRQATKYLDTLPVLDVDQVLAREGVPYHYGRKGNDFARGAIGVTRLKDGTLLLTYAAEADVTLPEWVEPIKASEYYSLIEAQEGGQE
jgi:hypothetical protein